MCLHEPSGRAATKDMTVDIIIFEYTEMLQITDFLNGL